MFKYDDINADSFINPPTDNPIKIVPTYECNRVTMEEIITVIEDNYPKKKTLFDKIFK
jgi:hypothetical protein